MGTFTAKVDEKGRLKLPSAFKEYICGFGSSRVFVTSLDDATLRLYPITVWKSNLNFLKSYRKEPRWAEHVARVANANGQSGEVDEQGRVLLPQEIRRVLGLENSMVHLECINNRINILGKEVFERELREAKADIGTKVVELEREGLE